MPSLVVALNVVGVALLVVAFFIQMRHRSPYSGATMDSESKRRFGIGAWIGAAGGLGILIAQLAWMSRSL